MNRLWLMMLLVGILALTACSSDKEKEAVASEKPAADTEEQETTEETAASVDKGLLSVEINIPPSMFEGEDIDTVIADAEAEGIKATKNDDGSVTYKMSKSKHKEMMAEMEQSISESIEEMKTSGDFVSIKDITYNKDFNEFTMVVDQAAYENSMDAFATFTLGFSGMMYQLFDGVKTEDNKVKINVKDEETNEVLDEILFPDDMNE